MAKGTAAKDTQTPQHTLAQANEVLEMNNVSLEEAQALTHLGSWQWNVTTNAVAWSDELYRIFGLEPQERAIGYDDFLGLIHPDDRDHVNGVIYSAFQTKQAFEFEHRIVLPNKKIRVLHGKGKSILDKSGNVTRMVGTAQDITERTRADQALRLSDERFKAVSAATSDVVYDIDLQDGTIWFNEALSSEYGYPKRKHRTPEWRMQHIHPHDQQRIRAAIDKLLASKANTWTEEYRFKTHDGTYIDVRDRAYVLRDHSKQPARIIGSMLDITQQKELERAKDKFISLVSHQLRTPLTAMRLLADMLSDGQGGTLSPIQKNYVDKINTSTVRMIQLVSDILNVSQIERGRLKIVPVPTDIETLIQWHIDEVAPLAAEKNITIKYKPVKSIPEVTVDPVLFSQIIHNLLANAVRYTSQKNTTIQVHFRQTKSSYVLSVSDQGIGIPPAVQRQIFSSFFRADNAVKMHGEGTGLGLYLVRLIMDMTGGKVWFISEQGKGATFYISLPLSGMRVKAGDKTLLQESYE